MGKAINRNKIRQQMFNKLVGKTIAHVDAGAVNAITLTDTEGNKFIIDSDDALYIGNGHLPILSITKVDQDNSCAKSSKH